MSTLNQTILGDLRDDLVGRLQSDAMFSDVTVLAEKPGVTAQTIELALAKGGVSPRRAKQGACAIVMMPGLSFDAPDVPGPEGMVSVEIQCLHRAIYNDADKGGTGKAAETLAIAAANLIHHYRPDGVAGVRGDWLALAPGIEALGTAADGTVGYRCRFEIPATVGRSARVARPAVTVAAGEITATCATAGARIYYTLDGSYPGSGNPEAKRYTAAVTEPTGDYVARFAAEDPDGLLLPSQPKAVDQDD